MAATAETLVQQADPFDWEFAEAQFAERQYEQGQVEPHDRSRAAESEIYGRSLGTIRQVGAFAIGKTLAEITASPEASQAKVEFYTSVEEGFGTDMELGGGLEVRDFDKRPILNGRVMAKDLKTPVSAMTDRGLTCAYKTADEDKRFQPQLVRSKWDHENALIVDKMVRNEMPYNTRIVVSPFPEEAALESGNNFWGGIGYVPHLRRGFVQLYHSTPDGLVTGSLSFDGSSKDRLREVFAKHNLEIPETERTDNWLRYAITGTLTESEAKELALQIAEESGNPEYKKIKNTVEVTNEHRAIMDKVFNDSYIHACESLAWGRQTPLARKLILQLADKAEAFNQRYAQALYGMRANEQRFSDDDMIVIHELLVYSTIEMMRALHLQKNDLSRGPSAYKGMSFDPAYLQSLNNESFQGMLGGFGAVGARANRSVFACGLSISPGEMNEASEGPQHVFGGLSKAELSWHGGKIKKGKCVNCKKQTDVGVENWCKSCIKC